MWRKKTERLFLEESVLWYNDFKQIVSFCGMYHHATCTITVSEEIYGRSSQSLSVCLLVYASQHTPTDKVTEVGRNGSYYSWGSLYDAFWRNLRKYLIRQSCGDFKIDFCWSTVKLGLKERRHTEEFLVWSCILPTPPPKKNNRRETGLIDYWELSCRNMSTIQINKCICESLNLGWFPWILHKLVLLWGR